MHKCKYSRKSKTILNMKNKGEGFIPPDFKKYSLHSHDNKENLTLTQVLKCRAKGIN
jgi:hypothetical protein